MTSTPSHGTSTNAAGHSFKTFFSTAKNEPIYVILGVQGSGTNLLRSILDRAFNFAVVQDQSLVYNAALAVGANPTPPAVRRQFEQIRSRLFPSAFTRKTRRLIKGNASFDGIDEHFDAEGITSGADLARFVYAYGAFSRGTRLMAIKSDDLWETIAHIDTVLPNRRIILLTRDFRDNLLSITKKDFGPIEPLIAARYVKDRFAYYAREYERTPAEHRLHVRYEDLLKDPDTFVVRFCEHFGLAAEGYAPPPVDTKRIRRHNVRKWASLTPRQLAHCEATLRDELESYGYSLESDPIAPPGTGTWLAAIASDAAGRVLQKLRSIVRRLKK